MDKLIWAVAGAVMAFLLAQLGANPNGNDWNREGKWVNGKWVTLQACVHGFIGKLADSYKPIIRKLMELGR